MQTFSGASAHDAQFLVTARELVFNGDRSSLLYIGKKVTIQHNLFRWLLILLVGMALLVDNAVKYSSENGAVQVKIADMTVKGEQMQEEDKECRMNGSNA